MTAKELNLGDVFRVVGQEQLWPGLAFSLDERTGFAAFSGKEIEVVERAGEICRAENTLILRGGAVTLEYIGAWQIHRCTPGDPLTEFVLTGDSFGASRAGVPTPDTALAFKVATGAREFGRPRGTELFAYSGRVYARATNREALGRAKPGGYYLLRSIDGERRLATAGLLTLPGEFALYDIIMEHFGPDTVPVAPAE